MTREFASIRTFALHAEAMALREPVADALGRRAVGELMVATAVNMIGKPANFWPLAASTVKERMRLGYSPYATLLRSGNYQRSFGWAHSGPRATGVGSTSPIARYHELGTPDDRPPKRSVLIDPSIKRDMLYFELYAKTYFLGVGA